MTISTIPLFPSHTFVPGGQISRRRAICLFGAFAGFTFVVKDGAIALPEGTSLFTWDGTALGAPAKLTLAHHDQRAAEKIATVAIDEIERLERIFSLHRRDSDLSSLNRDGRLEAPAVDLIHVMKESRRFGNLSKGAFDVTVQPLWLLFSEHFSRNPGITTGPAETEVETARKLVGYQKIDLSEGKVRLSQRGMAVTLNGIAQGYITDRVADLLATQGITQVLVELGETRALDDHPEGRPWRIGLADPTDPSKTTETIELTNKSVATSAGSGTVFGGTGQYHHLFDPRTGVPAKHHISASVITDRATTADAISTALFVLPTSQVKNVVESFPDMQAVVTSPDGTKHRFVG